MMRTASTPGRPGAPEEQTEPCLVSVIMIFLNAEQFIEEAIESVFSQTWPHWELLLVDDGSTDQSARIARGYAERHPERVRCLEHPGRSNRGMSASRNLGIAHACGKYVAFLDADDVYLPDRLARHIAVLENQPAVDMVQSSMIYWFSWTGDGEEDHALPSIGPPNVVITPPTMLSLSLNTPHSPNIGCVTGRRDAALEVNGFEDEFTSFCEDRVFLAKMYATKTIFITDECLVRYRRHPGSVTASEQTGEEPPRKSSARKAYFLWLRSFLESRSIDDPSLDAAIAQRLRVEDEQRHSASIEAPPLNRMLERVFRRLVRLVVPNSVRVRRRNRRRVRQWQQIRAELDQLRRDYTPAADGGTSREDERRTVQVERRPRSPEGHENRAGVEGSIV